MEMSGENKNEELFYSKNARVDFWIKRDWKGDHLFWGKVLRKFAVGNGIWAGF
jgi:hypothetical protein